MKQPVNEVRQMRDVAKDVAEDMASSERGNFMGNSFGRPPSQSARQGSADGNRGVGGSSRVIRATSGQASVPCRHVACAPVP
jgi:hypothetical protein